MNIKEFIWKNRISILLLLLLFLVISGTLLLSNSIEEVNKYILPDQKRNYNVEISSLYPPGYKQPTISLTPQVLGDSVEKAVSTKKPKKTKATPKPKVLPEKVSSTIEGRDFDRQLITEVLSDQITEYLFSYELPPEIYINKSGALLGEDALADEIFLYNGTQNRTNALSVKLISGTYLFSQVTSCIGKESKLASLNFIYDSVNNKIRLCKEDSTTSDYIIAY